MNKMGEKNQKGKQLVQENDRQFRDVAKDSRVSLQVLQS